MCALTADATSLIPTLLHCLHRLARLTTLRVVTGAHASCLASNYLMLMQLTALKLGQHLTVDKGPSKLVHSLLQEVHRNFE